MSSDSSLCASFRALGGRRAAYFGATAFALLAALGLSTTSLVLTSWASVESNDHSLSFGLVGYGERLGDGSHRWVAYIKSDSGGPSSPISKIVKASSVQICLILFGMALDAFALYAILHVLECFDSIARRRTRTSSGCCCCGCGRQVHFGQNWNMSIFAPLLAAVATLTFVAAAIVWPVLGVDAMKAFADSKGLNNSGVALGYCYGFPVISAFCSLVGAVLSFLAAKGDVRPLSRNYELGNRDDRSIENMESGAGASKFDRRDGGKFNVEAALAALEDEEDEIEKEFARARAHSREAREKDRVSKREARRPSMMKRLLNKVTRSFRVQPKRGGYGKVGNEDGAADENIPSYSPRPADVLNPFATHTDHQVSDYANIEMELKRMCNEEDNDEIDNKGGDELEEDNRCERNVSGNYEPSDSSSPFSSPKEVVKSYMNKEDWRDKIDEEDI